ncbi:MAG: hypothetical protein HC874_14255 [Richelia sp. SL_2_1]|nr:hypothetical protein [Richelia sp. SL_2_1]
MNANYYYANRIPEECRADVSAVIAKTYVQTQLNTVEMQFLFEVYNRYIAPADEPEDIGCSGCRTKVVGKMRLYVKAWEGAQ